MAKTIKVVMKPTSVIEARLGIDANGEVQEFFRDTCARYMDDYVPFRKGRLAEYIPVDKDKILYDQLYAEYQYYGERSDGSHKIVNRTLIPHPKATSYWDKVMWSAHSEDIIKAVQDKLEEK